MMSTVATAPGKSLSVQVRLSLVPLLLAGLLLPVAALAQVTYTGTAANQNFGSQAIGSTSAAKTFSFSVASGTTVGRIEVVAQGASNLDFTNATGGTCTVNVTIKPRFAGARKGAVVFYSAANNAGNQLGRGPIYFAIRAANVNHRSRREDFEILVREVVRIGEGIMRKGVERHPPGSVNQS